MCKRLLTPLIPTSVAGIFPTELVFDTVRLRLIDIGEAVKALPRELLG